MLTHCSRVRSNAVATILVAQSLLVSSAYAITIVVNNAEDAGVDCTLREAITSINSLSTNFPNPPTIADGCMDISSNEPGIDDQIHFSVATVNLSNGELIPTEDIYFYGGDEGVTITGDGANRIINLSIENGITIELENMTLAGGSANHGGAIYVAGAVTLVLYKSTISGNSANNGGGIYASGAELILSNSTVSGNSANSNGGGVAIANGTSVEVYNTTLSDNTAIGNGGGLHTSGSSTSYLRMYNSIIANSTGGDCYESPAGSLSFAQEVNNLIEDGSCSSSALNVDPILGPLADNGGPTYTHSLLSDSPAINTGNNLVCENQDEFYQDAFYRLNNVDQRGMDRPIGPACDIGSFEAATPNTILFDFDTKWKRGYF